MIISKYTTLLKVDENVYIIFNPLSGSIDVADHIPVKVISNIEATGECSGDLCLYLKQRGYIFENEYEESELAEKLLVAHEKQVESLPLFAVIALTLSCNFECIYCYQTYVKERVKANGKKPLTLNSEKVMKIFEAIDKLSNLRGKSKVQVVLFGGEPLLATNYPTIELIFKTAKSKGYEIGEVVTNGYYLKEYVPLLKEYNVKAVEVTIDGTREIHDHLRPLKGGQGTFDKIVEGIDAALNNGIMVYVRVNTNRYNIDNIASLCSFIINKKWNLYQNFRATLGITYPYGFEDRESIVLPENEVLSRILEQFDRHSELSSCFSLSAWRFADAILRSLDAKTPYKPGVVYCGANTTLYAFDPEGYIYACTSAIGDVDLSIGKYYPSFYVDEKAEHMWRKTVFDKKKCKDCKYALVCRGGCIYHSIASGHDADNPLCPPIEKELEILFKWYYNRNKNRILE